MANSRQPKNTQPQFENLESRRMLAAFETPWPNARELTVSFPSDGVDFSGAPNELHDTLDQLAPRHEWQELLLRGIQTWAFHADINVGLRPDSDADFGSPGMIVADPRFGDLRIGATPQLGVLANSLPFQVSAGTFSGDIALNSSANLTVDDWLDGGPVLPLPGTFDLFSLLLHESGNALGLPDNHDITSVMFGNYTVPKGSLTSSDIDDIQTLYGSRVDPFEMVDNGELATAMVVPLPTGFEPSLEQLSVRGSIVDPTDTDHYLIDVFPGMNELQLSLRTKGLSLLQGSLEIRDASGQLIAAGEAMSALENDVVLQVPNLSEQTSIHVSVRAKDGVGVYGVGDYKIELDYRSETIRNADPVLFDFGDGSQSIWAGTSWLEQEFENDTLATAELLEGESWSEEGFRSEWSGDVTAGHDVDVFRVETPAVVPGALQIHLSKADPESAGLKVRIMDRFGQNVGATGHVDENGGWVLEVAQPIPDMSYFLRVSVDPSSSVDVGSYVAIAEFRSESQQMNRFTEGTLVEGEHDDFIRWTSRKSKLYRFELEAYGDAAAIQMTIYDAQSHDVRLTLSTPAGITRSAFVLLPQGEYVVHLRLIGQELTENLELNYEVRIDGISDDQDPNDPENDPYSYSYNYPPYYYQGQYGSSYYNYTYYEPYEDPYYGSYYYGPYYYSYYYYWGY